MTITALIILIVASLAGIGVGLRCHNGEYKEAFYGLVGVFFLVLIAGLDLWEYYNLIGWMETTLAK